MRNQDGHWLEWCSWIRHKWRFGNEVWRFACVPELVAGEAFTCWAIRGGKRSIDYLARSTVMLATLFPTLNGGIFGTSVPYTYGRTLTYPLRSNYLYLKNKGDCASS